MKKIALLLLVLFLLTFNFAPVHAQEQSPSQSAEEIRSALFNAQMALGSDSQTAENALAAAEQVYQNSLAVELTSAAPQQAGEVSAAFAALHVALENSDAPAFAFSRARVWTGILGGSLVLVEGAVQAGQLVQAQNWLPVREYRTATRFSRPNADATLALRDLQAGTIDTDTALQYLHADLLDTYQARLNEALRDLQVADASDYAIRRAELAALAQGYFLVLSPAYADQRGVEVQQDALDAFDRLAQASLSGHKFTTELSAVQSALSNFRAAPLSPAEQSRRAGQLLRYLKLVPVEYARGVSDGQVTKPLEIQEALTFYEASQAAFDDLSDLLSLQNAAATAGIKNTLASLGAQLTQTSTNTAVADPALIQSTADELVASLQQTMPAEWQKTDSSGDFDVIASMLDQMETAVRSGEYDLAESARLEAYAVLESGPEAKISVLAPQAKIVIEDLFWNGRGEQKGLAYLLAQQAALPEIQSSRQALDAQLKAVQPLLSEQSAPAAVISNAGIIVFREGLEAILILASLLASFKGAESLRYRRPMWAGTALALLATVLTWFLARSILASLARYGEKLEAAVSLVAVGVLLLITNWFFHKTYWSDHLANFHAKKRSLLSAEAGITLGLISLGFTSVYREGFEVVLFLQALVLESSTSLVLIGIAVGLAATLLIGWVTFRLQAHLPYMQMLVITGMMIGAVLLIMIGKTVHVLQVVGWLPTTPLGSITLPYWMGTWLGTYATWQGILLQLLAGVFVIGSYYFAEGARKGKSVSLFRRALNFKR